MGYLISFAQIKSLNWVINIDATLYHYHYAICLLVLICGCQPTRLHLLVVGFISEIGSQRWKQELIGRPFQLRANRFLHVWKLVR